MPTILRVLLFIHPTASTSPSYLLPFASRRTSQQGTSRIKKNVASMVLRRSIPKSGLDVGYPTEQHEDVQIEISLDAEQDIFSILVTSEEFKVQCVVAVPMSSPRESPGKRQRNETQRTQSGISGLPPTYPQFDERIEKPAARGRRADYMRPMSPLNCGGRSCAVETRHNSASRPSRSRRQDVTVTLREIRRSKTDKSTFLRRSSSKQPITTLIRPSTKQSSTSLSEFGISLGSQMIRKFRPLRVVTKLNRRHSSSHASF